MSHDLGTYLLIDSRHSSKRQGYSNKQNAQHVLSSSSSGASREKQDRKKQNRNVHSKIEGDTCYREEQHKNREEGIPGGDWGRSLLF